MRGERVRRRAFLTAAVSGVAASLTAAACDAGDERAKGHRGGGRVSSTSAPTGSSSDVAVPSSAEVDTTASDSVTTTAASPTAASPTADAAQIATRATVPVLCWHQLREWRPTDDDYSRNLLICPPAIFRAQLDAVADDGWSTISPDQYLQHLTTGARLPAKPVLLTFDDSQGSQLSVGLPELLQRNMTATFFVMTVVLGKSGWLSRRDVRRLDGSGMTIGAHTWDHHRADQYSGSDWAVQLEEPKELLEKVVGKPVDHFAYPFGAWDDEALEQVTGAGYRTAYQLADRTPSVRNPLLTLRRDLVASTWTGPALLRHLDEVTG